MKAITCFVLVSCLISANLAFAFPFQQHKEAEQTATSTSAVASDAPNISPLNEFNNDNIFSIGAEFMKKAQQRIAQLEQSVINKIKHHSGSLEPKVYEMQNKTSKEIKKPDIYNNEDAIPLEVNNDIGKAETVVHDLSGDTLVNDRISQQQKASGLVSIAPDVEVISLDGNIPQAKYYYTRNHIDETPPKDLSRDTLVNDRISQQQASSGVVKIDPDSEIIDVEQPEQVQSQTRTFSRLPSGAIEIDPDTEIIEAPNGIDQVPAADLSRDTVVNQRASERVASGLIMTDPDSEFIDGNENKNYYVPNTIQQVPLADLSRDTAVNERIAEQQEASGLVMIDPDAELIDDKRNARPTNRNYYRVENMIQENPYRDMSADLRVNDIISRKEKESRVRMIDSAAEFTYPNAEYQNNMYYYVPYNYAQVARQKRVPIWYPTYERRVAQPEPQVVFYK